MNTMLSIPRTISRAARVRKAIQAWGSAIHSMLQLSAEGAGRGGAALDGNSAGRLVAVERRPECSRPVEAVEGRIERRLLRKWRRERDSNPR